MGEGMGGSRSKSWDGENNNGEVVVLLSSEVPFREAREGVPKDGTKQGYK